VTESPRPSLKASRAGIGLTTFALVALASAGTGILVSHGAKQLTQQPRTHTTAAARAPQLPSVPPPVLVDRAPGSFFLPPAVRRPAGTPAPGSALPAPFTPLPEGLVPLGQPPVLTPPDVIPPVVEPPVVEPPVVEPPVVRPPVVTPARQPSFVRHDTTKPAHKPVKAHQAEPGTAGKPGHAAHPAHPAHPSSAQDGEHPGPDRDSRPDKGRHNGGGRQGG
jgi:hypothetical protein